ncbi:MAG: flagellar hook capping FlgD N-terminal domain-containing protein [Reinekea sp.]
MADTTSTDISSVLGQYYNENRFGQQDAASSSGEMGKTEFLELMIAKLNNQDPLNPQEDAQFIAELAQFSTVEGIQNMSSQMEDLSATYKSTQALQASSLVGGAVTVAGNDTASLSWGYMVHGSAEVDKAGSDLVLQIEDSFGEIVEEVEVGYVDAGEMNFKWDGANLEINGEMADIDYSKFETDEEGNLVPHPEGDYVFRVIGPGSADVDEVLNVSVSRWVESVSILDTNEIQLNLDDGSTIGMDSVKAINAVY